MTRNINETFADEKEWNELLRIKWKFNLTWREIIIQGAKALENERIKREIIIQGAKARAKALENERINKSKEKQNG